MNRRLSLVSSLVAVIGYPLFAILAFARFPGAYSPMRNWLSDLGSSPLNPQGAAFYSVAIVLAGLSVLVFFIGLSVWFLAGHKPQNVMLRLAQGFGALGSLAMIMSAVFPISIPGAHSFWSTALYILLGSAFVFTAAALRYHPSVPRWLLALGILTAAEDILWSMVLKTTLMEWVTVALFLANVLLVGIVTARWAPQPAEQDPGGMEHSMSMVPVRGVSLYVEVRGHGAPLVLMHGGPGADHSTLSSLRHCADRFTLVYYDHRCNGRSRGAALSSMTFENLAADADTLREKLGFERWAVLGHSFGGMVALEYALRYPGSLSHLILMDTCGDAGWVARIPEALGKRGYSASTVETARRFFSGDMAPSQLMPFILRFGSAYSYRPGPLGRVREIVHGVRIRRRPDATIFGFKHLIPGWTEMNRLGEIQVPTLVLAGRDDFQFPPEHQAELANGIPNARLRIVEHAGHNAPSERPAEVIREVRQFLSGIDSGSV